MLPSVLQAICIIIRSLTHVGASAVDLKRSGHGSMQKIMLDWSEQSLATKRIFVVVLVLKMSIRVGPTRAGSSKWAFAASLTDTNAWLDRNLAFPTITDANVPYEFERFRASSRWWSWGVSLRQMASQRHAIRACPTSAMSPFSQDAGRWPNRGQSGPNDP